MIAKVLDWLGFGWTVPCRLSRRRGISALGHSEKSVLKLGMSADDPKQTSFIGRIPLPHAQMRFAAFETNCDHRGSSPSALGGIASTLSMRRPSKSTTSKRQPS